MRSIGRLVGLAALGLLVLLAGSKAEDEHDHDHCEAEGVGCPLPEEHNHGHARLLGEEDHDHGIDYHITLSSDRPSGVRLGKVVGFRMRIPDINEWHWHDEYDNHVEEVLVGFKFPAGGHDDHRRQLKPLTAVKTTTVKATAGGGAEDEHEHSLFMFRNYNVKPKLAPKAANRAHVDLHDGMVDWHLKEDMAYRPVHSFLLFGTVTKEWEEPLIEVYGFVKNATGCVCWEEHIKVAVLKPSHKTIKSSKSSK